MSRTPVHERYKAAETVLAVQGGYAARGQSLAAAALAGSREFVEWNHYPAADLRDREAGTLAYYHAHAAAERMTDEHGHFHVFVPSRKHAKNAAGYSHLIGISINARGEALRLFTTNRWVTAEDWLAAGQMRKPLASFRISARGRMAPVANWLTGIVRMFEDDILALLTERDVTLDQLICQKGRETVLEDRSHHIVSERKISVPAKMLGIETEFNAAL